MWINLAVCALLLLWSQDIGEDPPLAPLAEPEATPAGTHSASHKQPAGARAPRAAMPVAAGPSIDARAFQAAFRRQADTDLLPCLKTWRPPPSSLGLSATLNGSGHLTSVAPLDPTQALPGCATEAISAMDFRDLAHPLGQGAATLQWRVDW